MVASVSMPRNRKIRHSPFLKGDATFIGFFPRVLWQVGQHRVRVCHLPLGNFRLPVSIARCAQDEQPGGVFLTKRCVSLSHHHRTGRWATCCALAAPQLQSMLFQRLSQGFHHDRGHMWVRPNRDVIDVSRTAVTIPCGVGLNGRLY